MNEDPWFDRFIRQYELENFLQDFNNVLDDPIDRTIQVCQSEIDEKVATLEKLGNDPLELDFEEEDEVEYQYEIEEEDEEGDFDKIAPDPRALIRWELYFKEEEMYALFETKIIYAFKHFEIYTKRLLSLAYPDVNSRKLFNWQNLIEYLKLRNIDIKKIEGYEEVDQL